METRTVTVDLPVELLEQAQKQSGSDIKETIIKGLQILAASQAYSDLLKYEGKVPFSRSWQELKEDR